MKYSRTHIYEAERAQNLDRFYRRFFQNPYKILNHFIREGMTVMELGCGNGFFTIPLSKMVGNTGSVIGVDIQKGMLELLAQKTKNLNVKNIVLVKSTNGSTNVDTKVDFILAAHVIHEVSNQKHWLRLLYGKLYENELMLIIEPRFVVNKKGFLK